MKTEKEIVSNLQNKCKSGNKNNRSTWIGILCIFVLIYDFKSLITYQTITKVIPQKKMIYKENYVSHED